MTGEELYQKLRTVQSGTVTCTYDLENCRRMAVLINEIQELKTQKRAVILAHSYVSPEILLGVADYSGDSYQLSRDATRAECEIIVFAAVRFMGETAKILNPNRTVLIPGSDPGCSLADSITGEQVARLRAQYPEHTFVCYINTTAAVKAQCHVCVTSSNVVDICQRIPNNRLVFLPDRLMGLNLQAELTKRGVKKEIVLTDGTCYVHERYDPELIEFFRLQNRDLQVISHPECRPEVALQSDFVGSTSQMLQYVRSSAGRNFLLLTECGLSAKLQTELPDRNFIGSCSMCKHMKSNSLENILQTLRNPKAQQEVQLDPAILQKAQDCLQAMFFYTGDSRAMGAISCE